jgi:hypothetical protein
MIRPLLLAALAFAGCGSPQTAGKSSRPAASSANSGRAENATSSRERAPGPRCDASGAQPEGRTQRVLLVTWDNLYLEGALLVIPNIELSKVTPGDYERTPSVASQMDVVIFDDHIPTALPPSPTDLLFFHPDGPNSPILVVDDVIEPRITSVDEGHAVMRSVTMSDVEIEKSIVFSPDPTRGESAIAESNGEAIIVAKRDDSRMVVAFGFLLTATDLPLRVAFPLLLSNSLEWFASGCVPAGAVAPALGRSPPA